MFASPKKRRKCLLEVLVPIFKCSSDEEYCSSRGQETKSQGQRSQILGLACLKKGSGLPAGPTRGAMMMAFALGGPKAWLLHRAGRGKFLMVEEDEYCGDL